jgi:hypothetical protein
MKKKLKFLNFKKVFNNKIVAGEIPVMTTVSLGAIPIAGAVSSFLGGGGSSGSTGGSSSSGSSSSSGASAVTTPANAPAAPGGQVDAGGTAGCGASNPGATDTGIANLPLPTLPNLALPPTFCWVAREVYGQNNIKWQLFRSWMLNQSPKWFLELYLKHGESTANFLKNKSTLKNMIRIWMDYIISNKLKAEYNFAI